MKSNVLTGQFTDLYRTDLQGLLMCSSKVCIISICLYGLNEVIDTESLQLFDQAFIRRSKSYSLSLSPPLSMYTHTRSYWHKINNKKKICKRARTHTRNSTKIYRCSTPVYICMHKIDWIQNYVSKYLWSRKLSYKCQNISMHSYYFCHANRWGYSGQWLVQSLKAYH